MVRLSNHDMRLSPFEYLRVTRSTPPHSFLLQYTRASSVSDAINLISMPPKRYLSGFQPSGDAHLGNYLGAIRNWAQEISEKEGEHFYFIADLHAMTVPYDAAKLQDRIKQTVMAFMACGVEGPKVSLFVQSHIPVLTEMTWMMNCVATMGQLQRMTQFKEKTYNEESESVTIGLFAYPVLMSIDILAYQPDYVPVGEDQKQHVEFCRDVAQKFNSRFGETFKIPEPLIRKEGARIMGLNDPTKKMSKSSNLADQCIYLLDSSDEIARKIKRATTDSDTTIVFDEKRPGISNLLTIYQMLSGKNQKEIEQEFDGKGYKEFKEALTEIVIESLKPIQERYAELEKDPEHVQSVLDSGQANALPIAEKTLEMARRNTGLR